MPEFLPIVRRWFAETFSEATRPQREGWEAIPSQRDTLIVAPTGSGQTLAALLWALARLHRPGPRSRTHVDHRRGPRPHGQQARRAPRPLARPARRPGRSATTGNAAPAYRLLGHGQPPRRDARLPDGRRGARPGRRGRRLRTR